MKTTFILKFPRSLSTTLYGAYIDQLLDHLDRYRVDNSKFVESDEKFTVNLSENWTSKYFEHHTTCIHRNNEMLNEAAIIFFDKFPFVTFIYIENCHLCLD